MADPTTPATTPLPVFSLQCHKNVDLTLQFLPSLLKHCRDPIELIVHDDGSLTAEDRDRLGDRLGPVRIISREEADDLVVPKLAGRPKCLEYRREHPFGLKLLDPALIAGGPFLLCDGDILFLRDFEGLDRRAEPGEDLVFMRDWTTFYVFSTAPRYFGPYRTPLADYVNAGLLYCTPKAFDLDFIEWYIGNPKFIWYMWLAEQTVWAALAGRSASRFHDPSQVDFPRPSLEYRPDWTALHFVSPIRYLASDPEFMANLRDRAAKAQGQGLATLRTLPAIRHNIAQDVTRRVFTKFRPSYIQVAIDKGPIPIAR